MLHALIAQAAEGKGQAPQDPGLFGGGPTTMLWVMSLGMLFIMFFVLPGNRKARKQEDAMRAGLKKGMKVVTMAGIVGTVVGAQDGSEEITIRSEDTKMKVLRSSVLKVLGSDEAEANKTA
jgi:preprotein translocase YajC subunit